MPAESEEDKVFDVNLADFSNCPKSEKPSKKSTDYPGISYSCLSQSDSPCQENSTAEEYHPIDQNVDLKQTLSAESTKDIASIPSSGAVCSKMDAEVIHFDSLEFGGHYIKKSLVELETYSCNELKALMSGLSKAVEEISNQLVQLLLENDNLQQESDARNIAIEQLLKITVKVTETESKPVQMSVILSPDECEDV